MVFTQEALISEIFSRPALWREEHVDYKRKDVQNKLWSEVARKSFLHSGDEAKNKWKNLKDQYRKELRKISHSNSVDTGTAYIPKWKYFHLLGFLREYVSLPTDITVNHVQYMNEEEDSEQSTMSAIIEDHLADDTIIPEHHLVQRESLEVIGQHIINLEKEKLQLLEESMEYDKSAEETRLENADLNFFRSLLPYMESFSFLEKLELRQEIQQLIINRYKEKTRNKTNSDQPLTDDNMKVER